MLKISAPSSNIFTDKKSFSMSNQNLGKTANDSVRSCKENFT